jgi:hypothetical protein
MKKTAIIAGSIFLLFTAAAKAQTDPAPEKQPVVPVTATTTTSADKWNNHDTEKYKLLPMPAPLTVDKVFPVVGKYELTAKTSAMSTTTTDASAPASSTVTIALDETNKGIVWVDGLPQGRIKAMLRKSPGTFKIPAQKTADDKNLAEGVMIFDKDANTLDVCIGCTYNNEDPASAFVAPAEPVVDETVKVKTTKKKSTAKAKVTPVKTWKYSGAKVVEPATSSVVPMQ